MHEIHVLPDLCGEFSEVLFRFCISSVFYNVTKRVKDAPAHNQKTVLRNCGMLGTDFALEFKHLYSFCSSETARTFEIVRSSKGLKG
jgi:hypothetical protein